MQNLNLLILQGRLAKDPEIKMLEGDTLCAKYVLVVNDGKNKTTNEDRIYSFNCTAFRKNAEFAQNYLKKGTEIFITGKLIMDSYQNNEGKRIYSVSVIVNDQHFGSNKTEQANVQQGTTQGVPQSFPQGLPQNTQPQPGYQQGYASQGQQGYPQNVPPQNQQGYPQNVPPQNQQGYQQNIPQQNQQQMPLPSQQTYPPQGQQGYPQNNSQVGGNLNDISAIAQSLPWN